MDLINELDKSLKTPMMKQSKSNKEVRAILDNTEGITIEELQVIDVRVLTKELRIEVRNKLEWAYSHLSTELTRLIATRNGMPNRTPQKNSDIDNKNKELKDTIISQYEAIEKVVENYKSQEKLSEDENERKSLTYIRKVYSKALSEVIERLFSTAAEGTDRIKVFPLDEQKKILNKINNLRESIRSLTRKSKQNRLANLQQTISQLQQKNNKWENGVGGKTLEQVQTELNKISELEIKFSTAQTNLFNEQQVRQQTEDKIRQAEQFGLTEWNNLANQTGSETLTSLLDRPKKSELEKVERERDQRPNITIAEYTQLQIQNQQLTAKLDKESGEVKKITEKFTNLVELIENEISQGMGT